MRLRQSEEQRSLDPADRRELLRLIAAVPSNAEPEHPTLIALVEFIKSLDVPWWLPEGGTFLLRIDARMGGSDGERTIDVGLRNARRLAEGRPWIKPSHVN